MYQLSSVNISAVWLVKKTNIFYYLSCCCLGYYNFISTLLCMLVSDLQYSINTFWFPPSLQRGSSQRCCWAPWARTATGPRWVPHPQPGSTERAPPPPKTPSTPLLNHRNVTALTGLYCFCFISMFISIFFFFCSCVSLLIILSIISIRQCTKCSCYTQVYKGWRLLWLLFVTPLCQLTIVPTAVISRCQFPLTKLYFQSMWDQFCPRYCPTNSHSADSLCPSVFCTKDHESSPGRRESEPHLYKLKRGPFTWKVR